MAANIDSKFNRVLEIAVTSDESDDSIVATSVLYRRDGFTGTPVTLTAIFGAASATGHIITLGDGFPQGVTHIKLVPTAQA